VTPQSDAIEAGGPQDQADCQKRVYGLVVEIALDCEQARGRATARHRIHHHRIRLASRRHLRWRWVAVVMADKDGPRSSRLSDMFTAVVRDPNINLEAMYVGWEDTKNPYYAWSAIAICTKHKNALPTWVATGTKKCVSISAKARIPLPNHIDSDAFNAAYQATLAGQIVAKRERREPDKPGSIGALIRSYRRSAAYVGLRATTQAGYSSRIEMLKHGHRSVSGMTRAGIVTHIMQPYADRPGAALTILKMLRVLIAMRSKSDG